MKLRIGLLNDSFPPTIDGVANAVRSYADIIEKNFGESIVITPKYPNVTDNYPFEVYRYGSIPLDKKIGYRAGDPFSLITITDLRAKKMDLLHVHCPFASAVLARQICSIKKYRVPMVFTYHTKFDIDIQNRVKVKRFQKIALRFVLSNIEHMDEVWVVSEGAAESLRAIGYKGTYRVMPNGTDFARGKVPQAEIDEVERVYRLEKDELVFLFVGRMMWYKNLRLILDSLKIVKDAGIRFRMFFIGDASDRASVEQYAHTIGLGEFVEFTGSLYNRERLRAFFSRANLFLFPSTYDTSGLVVKEAAACDCPSLLVKGSCASEGVEHDFSGFLTDENPDACARAILDAIGDREHLAEIGRNAGDHVYLSWDDAVKAAYHRYEEILADFQSPLSLFTRIKNKFR